MGTRARINVMDNRLEKEITDFQPAGQDPILLTIYKQFDGYPYGLGKKLQDFAKDIVIVNGYSGDGKGQANGMGCFAAQLVKELKKSTGSIYIIPIHSQAVSEEYCYNLYEVDNHIHITCISTYEPTPIYSGKLADWDIEGDIDGDPIDY